MLNKLLFRQIQKHCNDGYELFEKYPDFLNAVSNSYDHCEKERNMLELAIEVSSEEMIELNTKLRKEKTELEKALSELNTLFENIDDVFFSVDLMNKKLLQISSVCEKIYGYAPADFYENLNLWYDVIVEEDKPIFQNNFPVMNSGMHFIQEYRIIHKNGTIRWLETKLTPTLNDKGKLIRIDGLTADITIRKESEREKEQMIKELTQNNTDLKQFSYITSHNLRAPIAHLLGLTNLVEGFKIEDEELKKILYLIKDSAIKFDDTIKDLNTILLVKDNPTISQEELFLSPVFEKVKKQLLFEKMDIQVHYNFEQAPKINFNRVYLESVFLNLLTNALKYKSCSRNLIIRINSEIEEENVVLKFQDNGIGIDLDTYKDRIFKLYQKFHKHVEGKGLGLFLIRSQMEALGGTIEVESKIDVGTTFILKFKNRITKSILMNS